MQSTYLIRPEESQAIQTLNLATKNFLPQNREQQIQDLLRIRNENPLRKELNRWLQDHPQQVRMLPNPEPTRNITGTTLLKTTPEQAEQIKKDLPGLHISKDQTIKLIQPLSSSAKKSHLKDEDLWHFHAIGLNPSRSGRPLGRNTTVAVLDTGINDRHPEIQNKIKQSYSLDPRTLKLETVPIHDAQGHGTHVAGLLCGRQVGIAPATNLISCAILPNGKGEISHFVRMLETLSEEPDIDIINISAGIIGYSSHLNTMIDELMAVGLLPVCAIGNEGRNSTCSPGNCRQALSVGAIGENRKIAAFSSSGTIVQDSHQYTVPSLVAPGDNVYSCVHTGGYEAWSGTSMAAPIVSGVAATLLEQYPKISVLEMKDALLSSCQKLSESPLRQGEGLLQAAYEIN